MRCKETVPIVIAYDIVIVGLLYKGEPCGEVNIQVCSLSGECINAACDSPYFVAGTAFWKEIFGSKQIKGIRAVCKRAFAKI